MCAPVCSLGLVELLQPKWLDYEKRSHLSLPQMPKAIGAKLSGVPSISMETRKKLLDDLGVFEVPGVFNIFQVEPLLEITSDLIRGNCSDVFRPYPSW